MEERKGTTTIGIVCKGGVVLASDKRASLGYMIANKEVQKTFKITDRIALTIAGIAADGQKLAQFLRAEMNLYKLNTGIEPTLTVAANLMSNILFGRAKTFLPYIVQLILGGWEEDGTYALYTLDPSGSCIKESKYYATGSGSPMAFGVLEDGYKEGLNVNEGVELALRAMASALKRDLATGEGVDVTVIDQSGYRKIPESRIKEILETKSVKL